MLLFGHTANQRFRLTLDFGKLLPEDFTGRLWISAALKHNFDLSGPHQLPIGLRRRLWCDAEGVLPIAVLFDGAAFVPAHDVLTAHHRIATLVVDFRIDGFEEVLLLQFCIFCIKFTICNIWLKQNICQQSSALPNHVLLLQGKPAVHPNDAQRNNLIVAQLVDSRIQRSAIQLAQLFIQCRKIRPVFAALTKNKGDNRTVGHLFAVQLYDQIHRHSIMLKFPIGNGGKIYAVGDTFPHQWITHGFISYFFISACLL